MKPQLLVGAASSGSGKTTFTLGLLRALKNRSLKAQPFKCGPDYIDTKYHLLAAGEESVNLDLFLSSESHIRNLYAKYGTNSDICITEGVMGLYDGYDGMKGSSAKLAELLGIPVVLILNAKSMAYSAAPVLFGYKHFNKNLNIAGVVFNRVSSETHYAYLQQACKDTGVECLGYIPNKKELEVPSRHLGLSIDNSFCMDDFANRAAEIIEEFVDLDRLLKISNMPFCLPDKSEQNELDIRGDIKIAVAYDNAFNFIYRENLAQLKRLGEVAFFSPLDDVKLPSADLVYLPGGYPELYLDKLTENKTMLRSIKAFAENGGNLLAECGGMMYLSKVIVGMDGNPYSMVGVFDQEATMQDMKLTLGYRTFTYNGIENIRGHEFHYSRIKDPQMDSISDVSIYNAKGLRTKTNLFRYKNTIAGYTHLYWGELDLMNLWNHKC